MKNSKIPCTERLCMTIEEAAEYSMIGENRLRKLVDDDKNIGEFDWVLRVGERVRIKRNPFEKWVIKQSYL